MKFAIILSGSGVFDGSEIHEAVMTMLAVKNNGADYSMFAPNINQAHVINHITGEVMNETRNVLTESARIARGKISNITNYKASDFDGIILPGGFGAAKNLSNYAFNGDKIEVNKDVEKAIKDSFAASKPIAAICIAPVILAKVLNNTSLTIGSDSDTANHIEALNNRHITCKTGSIVIDKVNKIVTSPCYMQTDNIVQIAQETDKVIKALLEF